MQACSSITKPLERLLAIATWQLGMLALSSLVVCWCWTCIPFVPMLNKESHAHPLLQGPEELFEVTAQCLMSGQDRDAISGWGAIIHVM